MKEIVNKLMEIERKTSAEKGGYDLFALFMREGSFNLWDIVVAAEWIDENQEKGLRYIAEYVQRAFTAAEIVFISHIAIIDATHPELPSLQEEFNVEHGQVKIKDELFLGKQIEKAIFITAKRRNAAINTPA